MKYNYIVNKFNKCERIEVVVPGSKSITNRAFMLAALSNGSCRLEGVLFSDDSRAFLSCLVELGFEVKIDEDKKEVIIYGLGGRIPNKDAKINVRSAGTAARFLTAMVAFAGGNYLIESSDQNSIQGDIKFLDVLKQLGCSMKDTNIGIEVKGPRAMS